jgi:hypothetical protein
MTLGIDYREALRQPHYDSPALAPKCSKVKLRRLTVEQDGQTRTVKPTGGVVIGGLGPALTCPRLRAHCKGGHDVPRLLLDHVEVGVRPYDDDRLPQVKL